MTVETRVLLVEDEASLKRSLEKYLERAGYTFDSCSTAREALALAEKFEPDIVITEYRLPDANGVTLVDKLKRILPDTVAILLSEYDFQAVAKDLVQVTVRSFLKKPFDLVELESALSSARTKANLVSVENVEGERRLGFEGIPVSILK